MGRANGEQVKGNCDQVKEVVNQLVRYGNQSVYGIIDWDLKNNGNDHIKVLGHQKRYSIESYVFDPLILVAFLLREKILTRDAVGFRKEENYLDLIYFDSERLQLICDTIVSTIKDEIPSQDTTTQACVLVNNKTVSVPNWYLKCNGHDLEQAIKNKYQSLKKYGKEGELKSKVIETVIDDIPSVLSKDILDLLLSIQNYSDRGYK